MNSGWDIPRYRWEVIQNRINEYWVAREAPHISVMAKTRAGKSYLMRHGILPLARNDRVLILDAKGDDATLRGLGKPVREIPSRVRQTWWGLKKPQPEDQWFRLVIQSGPANKLAAIRQVRTALERVMREGDWIVIFDELRVITDHNYPGLGLKPYYEEIILRGGSRGVASVSLSQEPRWLPGCFYTQSNFYFFSRIEDAATQKRVAEVGSVKELLPIIQQTQNRHWVYMDDMNDTGERFWGRTYVEKRR